jgi:hypothetical protein
MHCGNIPKECKHRGVEYRIKATDEIRHICHEPHTPGISCEHAVRCGICKNGVA